MVEMTATTHQNFGSQSARVRQRAFARYTHPMPELCRFFGIIIRMYMEAGQPHHFSHFHAYYQSEAAVFSLDPIELIAGSLPREQTYKVLWKPGPNWNR